MKNRKIFFTILAFIIIEIAFFFYVEYLHKKEITNYLAEKTTETEIKLNAVRGSYKIMIETLFKQIINKPHVLELYSNALEADSITKNEIRDSLYNLLLPTYEQLKVANIRQFIFIFPNNEVFLRFHRPEKFGDDLTNFRYSVKMANQTKQIYTGFEEGRTLDGFRNIFPIYYEGRHIGVIEISFSDAINVSFRQDDDVFTHIIKKEIVNLKLNASQKNRYIQSLLSDEYLHEKEFLHYNNDTTNVLKQIDKNIKPIIAERLANNESFTIYHHINKTDYLITFISVKNTEGNPVAYVIAYHKDEHIIADLDKQFFRIHLIGLFFLAIIILAILQVSLKNQKLRETKIQEKKILDTFKEGIYIVSPDYNITYANSALQKRIGQNVVGQKCYKAVHNLNKKCNWCIYENLKQEKNTIDYEFETEDNKTLVSNNTLLADNSKLTILTDITENKKNEQALKESEEKLNIFMNNLPGCAFIKDNKGKYVFLNKHFETIYGFDIPKLTGKGDEEIWGKEKALEYFEYDNEVKKNKTAILIEDKIQIKGKEYNWLTSKFNLPNDYIAGISFDISKQKEAEEALKESEEKYRILSDDSIMPIVIHDKSGKIKYGNNALVKLIKAKNLQEILKTPVINFIHPDYIEEVTIIIKELFEKGGSYNKIQKFIRFDGEYIDVDVSGKLINYNNEKAIQLTFNDITERIKAEKALKESEAKLRVSNKTKDKFFSIIAHDLKSPFNAILGFSDILVENHKKYDDEKRNMMIKAVNNSANDAFKLLDNLLTWSRSESGRIPFIPEKLHLKILLLETISNLQASADQKQIQLFETISEGEIVFADKNMITTVLRNLISNAIKFTNKGGSITISSKTHSNSDFLEISVEDSGVGIPNEKIDDIFRIDKNTSTKGTENEKGTGLGLILCKEFVEKHGGKIWVESKIDKGSTFYFTILNK